MLRLTLLFLFLSFAPLHLIKGECKYYKITLTEVEINSACFVVADGPGLEDPTINIYCLDQSTLHYSSEWEIDIPTTGSYPLPALNWNFCADNNEFIFGPIPEGDTSIDLYLELFESDDNDCSDHADPTDDCINTGVGTLSLNPGVGQLAINGNNGIMYTYFLEELNTVIEGITVGTPLCQSNNTYSIDIELTYQFENFCDLFPNSSPDLIVNGHSFVMTGSPQIITLVDLPANGNEVDINVSLSDNGCEQTYVNAFSAPSIPEAMIEAPDGFVIDCNHFPLNLDASSSSGDLPLEYLWNTGENKESIDVAMGDSYQLTVTSQYGCTSTTAVDVSWNLMDPEANIVSTEDTLTCLIEEILLDASASFGTGELLYEWNTGESSSSISIDNAGLYQLTITDTNNGCTQSIDYMVWEDVELPQIVIDIPDGDTLNCSLDQLVINALSNNLEEVLIYDWSNGETSSSTIISEEGLYTLTVIDSNNGCSTSLAINIWEDVQEPQINIDLPEGDTLNCVLSQIVIDASSSFGNGDLSYIWNTGEAGEIITVSDIGPYTLTITDNSNGCTSETAIDIWEDIAAPNININLPNGDTLNCELSQIQLDVTNSSENADLSYEWSTGETQELITIDEMGTYFVTVTDNANECTNIAQVSITKSLNPPEIIINSPNGDTLNCYFDQIILDGTASTGGGALEFLWSTDESTQMISVSEIGTYVLTITDIQNACTSTAEISISQNIDQPEINLEFPNGDTISCAMNELLIDASSSLPNNELNYLWYDGSQQPTNTISNAGEYSLTVTDLGNGCTHSETFLIEENTQNPDLTLALPAGDVLQCNQSDLSIVANSNTENISYEWNTGEISQTINIGSPGLYQLTITAENGCTESAEIEISIDNNVVEIFFDLPGGAILNCNNPTLSIDASSSSGEGSLMFSWNNGMEGEQITVSETGIYALTIIDQAGCITTDSIQIMDDFSMPDILFYSPLGDTLDCTVELINLDASGSTSETILSYEWSTGESQSSIDITSAGIYYLTITQANGCSDIDSFEVFASAILPTINLDFPLGQTINCLHSNIIIDASQSEGVGLLNYNWSTNENTEIINVNNIGDYTLTVSDQNGCSSSSAFQITEDLVEPVAIIGLPLGETLGCELDSIILDASPSMSQGILTYNWSTNQETENISIGTPANYALTITDINGCKDIASVEIFSVDELVISYEVTAPSCYAMMDGIINVQTINGGTPPYFAQVDNTTSMELLSFPYLIQSLDSGEYSLTIIDSGGCTWQEIINIPEGFEPFAQAGDDISITAGSNVIVELITNLANPTIIWTPSDNVELLNNGFFQLTPESTTNYVIELTDENGCQALTGITISIDHSSDNIYIPNVFSPTSGITSNQVFTFFGNFDHLKTVHTFSIYDRWGNQMYEASNSDNFQDIGWNGQVNNQMALTGVYVYHVVIEYNNGTMETFVGDIQLIR